MIGAIAGDIIGSRFEFRELAKPRFTLFTDESRFTDDTVLTVAMADRILHPSIGSWPDVIKEYYNEYPDRGYGGGFRQWVESDSAEGYNSFGNGSAMRTSPIAWVCDDLPQLLDLSASFAKTTHNHEEGIKGAQAIAACIYLARTDKTKKEIRKYIEDEFYHIPTNMREAALINKYNIMDKKECSCQKTVPLAIRAFLSSKNYISAVRSAVMLGGDTDTIACMTGAIAEAYYGHDNIPVSVVAKVIEILPAEFIEIIQTFNVYLGLKEKQ